MLQSTYLKKFLFIIFVLISVLSSLTRIFASEKTVPYILVSVAPHKFFVEKIAGKTVSVGLIVPAGASAHTYEPTPKQMMDASHANIWFYVGEGFEPKVRTALHSYNPEMRFIDLRKNLDMISYDHNHQGCSHVHEGCYDLHYWLSPMQAKIQAQTIADGLSKAYPENTKIYQENLFLFLEELDQLDKEIREIMQKPHNRKIMVSHPAYAYFCRDYGCNQLSIEFEGKDPTPKQLTRVIQEAEKNKIKSIFIQTQYSSKGARLIASQIGAKVVDLNPYSENYRESMLKIAHAFVDQ